MDAEDPLFIFYTGETADAILHTHGGYMVGAATSLKWVFDIRREDVYWCTADPSTITGHTYLLYAPFILAATTFLYEGSPTYPHPGHWPQMMNRYGISLLYSDPATVTALQRVAQPTLGQLRLLGVNAPVSEATWHWLYDTVGQAQCPVLTTRQQPETGGIDLTTLHSMPLKPGSVGRGFPGLETAVVDEAGETVAPGTTGHLVFQSPWPAMLRGLIGSTDQYIERYWESFAEQGWYWTGQQASQDEDGYIWLQEN
jgi:acetyl-CoA synthetase